VGDIRLTTRFADFLGTSIFASLHEAGHGMYEQGSPMEWDRTSLAGGVSLGLHESQSRLWENVVGRSRGFWEHFYPDLQQTFPAFTSVPLDAFHLAVNKVRPSLIRVEADELTYNLHVLIRFEIECDVLSEELEISQIPEAWNEKYREYLGVVPDSDSDGCLQDVHWSDGLIGYFPTYTMGNILSYQIWEALKQDVTDADAQIARGEFGGILGWLRERMYAKGRSVKPQDLIRELTGSGMDAGPYLHGLRQKYGALYGL
jgi:carboxypeptidase Taq